MFQTTLEVQIELEIKDILKSTTEYNKYTKHKLANLMNLGFLNTSLMT